jgi:hypothetical protein
MKRWLVFAALGWLVVVTLLHLWLNLGAFEQRRDSTGDLGPRFRVGFLPVT